MKYDFDDFYDDTKDETEDELTEDDLSYILDDDPELEGEFDDFDEEGNERIKIASVCVTSPEPVTNNQDYLIQLMDDYHSGDETQKKNATEQMLKKLEGYVKHIIKKKYDSYIPKDFEDLLQSGMMGIVAAMGKYDPEKGAATTYFKRHIIHELQKYIDTMKNHTSTHYSNAITKIKHAQEIIEKQGRIASKKDIAMATGLSMETISRCLDIQRMAQEKHYEKTEHLEACVSERFRSPEDIAIENERNQRLYESLTKLTRTRRQIVLMKNGIGYTHQYSLKEISEELGIPIDKVRKENANAFGNLRVDLRDVHRDYIKEAAERTIHNTQIPLTVQSEAEELMDILEEVPLLELEKPSEIYELSDKNVV